ncbi:MAG: 2Fe-2S iron-sulfur cluster-binding protein [Candidatus Bathyarchaeia archaeon]
MKTLTLTIDGKEVKATEGMTILEAAKQAGIEIPTLCHFEKLEPYGGCRVCSVEIEKKGKNQIVASCCYPVEEQLKVKTNSEKVEKIRKIILELLLPLSTSGPVTSLAQKHGVEKSRFPSERTECILCGLCVRYCAEVKGEHAVTFVGRGASRKITLVPEKAGVCALCRECYNLCPTGKVIDETSV